MPYDKFAQGGKKEAAWCKDPMDKKGKKTRPAARQKAAMRRHLKMDQKRFEVLVRVKKRKRKKFVAEEESLWEPGSPPRPL